MLKREEDTSGTRTTKHARRPSSGPNKTFSKGMGSHSNDHSGNCGNFVASGGRGENSQHGAQVLSQASALELLEQDERPTFVVDIEGKQDAAGSRLSLLFVNPALEAQTAVVERIEGRSEDLTLIFATSTPHRDFRSWVLNTSDTVAVSGKSVMPFAFAGLTWRYFTISNGLRIVHGNTDTAVMVANEKNNGPNIQQLLGPGSSSPRSAREVRPEAASYFDSAVIQGDSLATQGRMSILYECSSTEQSSESSREQYSPKYGGSPIANGDLGISEILTSATDSTSSKSSQKVVFPVRLQSGELGTVNTALPSEPGFFDWTRLPVTPALPLHIQFARSIDWGATSLGRFRDSSVLTRIRFC